MSETDELRRLLDERGVEYFKHEDGEPLRKLEKADEPATSWHMGSASVCAVPIEGSNLFDLWIDHCTPEQAIAATLGVGTLTAKHVMAIAGKHQPDYCSDTHVCFDWQAIADELNATLGETPTPPPPTMPEQPPYDLLIDLLRDEWDIDVSWDGLRRFWYVGLTDEGVRKRDEREASTLGDTDATAARQADATDAKPTQAESSGTCRDDLQRANAENAKLREQIHWLKKGDVLHVLTDQELAEQQKHEREMQASVKALDDENAKLRELVEDMVEWAYIDSSCDLQDQFADRMRELGIEVEP